MSKQKSWLPGGGGGGTLLWRSKLLAEMNMIHQKPWLSEIWLRPEFFIR